MPSNAAAANAPGGRQWRNRRPAAKRAELTYVDVQEREADRQATRRTSALHVQLTKAEKAEIMKLL